MNRNVESEADLSRNLADALIGNDPLRLEPVNNTSSEKTGDSREGTLLGNLPLRELVARIARDSDLSALHELHNRRTLFSFREDYRLLLANYLNRLRESATAGGWEAHSDRAYDLTLDKFSHFPNDGTGQTDCRNYFNAALRVLEQRMPHSELRGELLLAQILQRLIYKHFQHSLRESKRNGLMTRYEWEFLSGKLMLLMPRSMTGSERRRWLEENVPDIIPSRLGERNRIQALIDDAFADSQLPLDEEVDGYLQSSSWPDSISVHGLAQTLASEKADGILELRPTIQGLGVEKLEALIHRIFDQLSEGALRDGEIAHEFGLTTATFSRFAGSQWNASDLKGVIPDLWRNLARLLASHEDFIAAATEAGIWNRVVAIQRASQ